MKRFVFAALLSVAGMAFAQLPQPLIHWSMDDIAPERPASVPSSGTCDTTLELAASVVVTNLAAIGKALWFDGSRLAYSFSGKKIAALGSRTISFWLYRNETGEGLDAGSPMLFYGASSMYIRLEDTTGNPGALVTNNDIWFWLGKGGALDGYYISYNRRPRVTPGVWTHFACTIDVKSKEPTDAGTHYRFAARLYQNGTCIFADENAEADNIEVESQWFVGSSGTNQPMTGGLDEIKVWDSALDGDQIREEFARATDVRTTRLLCKYDFDDLQPATGGGYTVANSAEGSPVGSLSASAATSVTDGPGGKALHFDGSAETGAEVSIPFAMGESTIAFWCRAKADENHTVNPPFFQFGNHMMGVVASIDRSYMTYMLKYQLVTDATQFEVDPGYAGRDGWQHFVIVRRHRWDESQGKAVELGEVWYNGTCIHAGDPANVLQAAYTLPGETLMLGKEPKYDFRLNGDLRDFHLFSGALSSNDVVRLYRGPAEADAGADFAVAGDRAVLHGAVGYRAGSHLKGYDGEVAWSLVSAPAGGEGAEFLRPGNPETEVSLPVEGAYVFRLTVRGIVSENADEVTVTRLSAAGTAPAVSASCGADPVELPGGATLTADVTPGAVVAWSKVSGPGAVWFEPANAAKTVARFGAAGSYVLRATALKDGATAQADVACTVVAAPAGSGLTTGLLHRWDFDGLPGSTYKDSVAGLEIANYSFLPTVDIRISSGVSRSGIRSADPTQGAELGTFVTAFHEDYHPDYTAHELPKDEWRTLSVWAYQDKAASESMRHYAPCFFSERISFWCTLNRYSDPKTDGLQQTPGVTIVQSGNAGLTSTLFYAAPYSFTNRWTHFVFQVNRHDSSLCELWIDGVQQTPTAVNLSKYASGPLQGHYNGGRNVAQKIMLGGIDYVEDDYNKNVNNTYSVAKDTATGEIYYRTFPGMLDDARIYGRKLNPGEIRYLAQNPDLDANFAPFVSEAAVSGEVGKNKTVGISAASVAYGKGPAPVTQEWVVASGDPAKVVFADRTSAATQVTFLAKGHYSVLLKTTDGERTSYGPAHDIDVPADGMVLMLK